MQARSFTFFPLNQSQQLEQSEIETPLHKIQKIIDAQLAFNELLARQVVDSNSDELLIINLSYYIKLSDISLQKSLTPELVSKWKNGTLKQIFSDIKHYKELKSTITNFADLDYLYLHVHSLREGAVLELMAQDVTSMRFLLSHVFSGDELRKQTKKVMNSIKVMGSQSPVKVEINTFNEIINILRPQISASCLRYVQDFQIKDLQLNERQKILIAVANEEMNLKQKQKQFEEQVRILSQKNIPNLEMLSLSRVYSQQVHNMSLSPSKIDENFHDGYFTTFDKAKKLYEAEEKLREKLRESSALLVFQEQSIQSCPPAVPMENVEPTKSPRISRKFLPSANTEKPVNETLSVSLIEAKDTIISEIQDEQNLVDLQQVSYPMASESSNQLKVDIDHTEIPQGTQDDVEPHYTSYYRQFSKKSQEKKPQEIEQPDPVKRNGLELSTTEQDIFLKVFGLCDYETINLRALVSLACDGFKATITTTGSNRCRIEIKNIYAILMMSDTALLPSNQCQKATVTMHGGGHRSKKSLNNDRGNAPGYLIDQFRAAFERAGFTPENLGLENEAPAAVVSA